MKDSMRTATTTESGPSTQKRGVQLTSSFSKEFKAVVEAACLAGAKAAAEAIRERAITDFMVKFGCLTRL